MSSSSPWSFPVPDEDYVAPIFKATRGVARLNSVPRFGRVSDIAYVASANRMIQIDYGIGIMFLAALILLVFLVWSSLLLIFRCIGSRQVGCAAGRRFEIASLESIQRLNSQFRPHGLTDEEREWAHVDQWKWEATVVNLRAKRVRFWFLVFAAGLLGCAVVLIMYGLLVLDGAYHTTQEKVEEMGTSIKTATNTLQSLMIDAQYALPQKQTTLETLDAISTWCPKLDANRQATGIFLENGGQIRQVTIDVGNASLDLANALDGLGSLAIPASLNVYEALLEAMSEKREISAEMASVDWWFLFTLIFIGVICFLTLLFMIGALLAWHQRQRNCFQKFLTYFGLPLFVLMISMTWFFTSGFSVMALMTSDVCTGAPEQNLATIFHEKETRLDPLVFQMTSYYVEGCTREEKDEKPLVYLDNFNNHLDTVANLTQDFQSRFQYLPVERAEACGSPMVNSVLENVTQLDQVLGNLSDLVDRTVESFYCDQFNPIALDIFHDAICDEGVSGISVILTMLFAMVVCGMSMITLRTAWINIDVHFEPPPTMEVLSKGEPILVAELVSQGYLSPNGHLDEDQARTNTDPSFSDSPLGASHFASSAPESPRGYYPSAPSESPSNADPPLRRVPPAAENPDRFRAVRSEENYARNPSPPVAISQSHSDSPSKMLSSLSGSSVQHSPPPVYEDDNPAPARVTDSPVSNPSPMTYSPVGRQPVFTEADFEPEKKKAAGVLDSLDSEAPRADVADEDRKPEAKNADDPSILKKGSEEGMLQEKRTSDTFMGDDFEDARDFDEKEAALPPVDDKTLKRDNSSSPKRRRNSRSPPKKNDDDDSGSSGGEPDFIV